MALSIQETHLLTVSQLPTTWRLNVPWRRIYVSPDGRHVAYIRQEDGKQVLIVDGDEAGRYDCIHKPYFSPDSRHIAFFAEQDGKSFIIVDGSEGFHYDGINIYIGEMRIGSNAFGPEFSADSRHIGYAAYRGEQYSAIIDGNEGPPNQLVSDPIFSSDSQRTAYVAYNKPNNCLVIDNEYCNAYSAIFNPSFSPNSARVAYQAWQHGKEFVVCDKEEGARFKRVGVPSFSPDSQHIAYLATTDSESYLVIDNENTKAIGIPKRKVCFSPDSKRIAYGTRLGKIDQGISTVVVDGSAGREYMYVGETVFSQDSAHFAYHAHIEEKRDVIVVDGDEEPEFEIASRRLCFSTDNRVIYYGHRDNADWLVIGDQLFQTDYRIISPLEFKTPFWFDTPEVLCFCAVRVPVNSNDANATYDVFRMEVNITGV